MQALRAALPPWGAAGARRQGPPASFLARPLLLALLVGAPGLVSAVSVHHTAASGVAPAFSQSGSAGQRRLRAASAVASQASASASAVPRVSPEDAPFSCCDEAAQPPPTARPRDQAETIFSFALERTGLAGSGMLGIDDFEPSPALCLTATNKQDQVGGFGLRLQPCESSFETFGQRVPNNTDPELRKMQQFVLDPSGQIQTPSRSLCIRRMRCGDKFLYDLGRCDGPGYAAVFEVKKASASSLAHLMPLGTPAQAVKLERCITCGPYVLTERCLARGEAFPVNSQGHTCGENWQAEPGWTKLPATYVGDAVASGRRPKEDSYDTVAERLNLHGDDVKDLAGLMVTDFDGICGSYAQDGPTMDSVFFLHRQMPSQ